MENVLYQNTPNTETTDTNTQIPVFIRQSAYLLFFKLLLLELLCALILSIIIIPQSLISRLLPEIGTSLVLVVLLSIFTLKIYFTLLLTSQWADEFYKVKLGEIIYYRQGIFSDREEHFNLTNVESIRVIQDLPGRLLRYGTIELINPVLKKRFILSYIPNPAKYIEVIDNLMPKGNSSQAIIIQGGGEKFE